MVVAGVLLTALALVLVYPAVLGGRVLAPEDALLFNAPLDSVRPASLAHPSNYLLADAVEVFHPDLQWARAMVRAGQFPLWNPYVCGGWPAFASQQTAVLYPLTAVAYVLPFWSALGVIVVLKVLLAGVGMWWLCRRLGLGMAAALLAAVAYSLGSYFVIWLEHPQTNVYALIPWLLGAIEAVCARRRTRDAGLLAAVVGACLLGGQPGSSFIAALACLPFALLGLSTVRDAGARRRSGVLLGGAVLLGVAAGAVMLLPFAQMAGQATQLARGGGSGMPDRSLLSLLLPDLWGRPNSLFEGAGPVNYAERTVYVGALPLMLAVAGLWRPRDRWHWFFGGLLVGASLFAVHVPVVTGVLHGLPGLSAVNLNRALILVVLSLAMLAGYGLQRMLDATPAQRRVMLIVAAGVGCAPILWLAAHGAVLRQFPRFADIAPSLWGSSTTQTQTGAAAATRWLVMALPGLGVLWLLARSRSRERRGATSVVLMLVVALVAGDLLALNHGFHPAIARTQAAPPPTPSLVTARAEQGNGRTLGFDEYLIPNVGSRYALRDPRVHGLPALTRYLALWNGLGGYGFQGTRLRPGDPRAAQLLDDFGVSLLLASPHERAPTGPGLQLVTPEPDGTVYRNTTALPRAYLAASWRPAANRQAALAATLASTTAKLRTAPVIEGVKPDTGAGLQPASGTPAAGGDVTFTGDGANTVELHVDAPQSGYLVLLDTSYPGWSATVDGHETPIHAANEAFRAVAIPSGRHHVMFRYRPTALIATAGLSALAWIAILTLTIVPILPRRRHGRR
jgi:hypothetical protein